MSANVGFSTPWWRSRTLRIHSSIILKVARPRMSNLMKPIGSSWRTFWPSDQGVCRTPLEAMRGMNWSSCSPITTPPAWREVERICPISPTTWDWTRGYWRKNAWRVGENSQTSSKLGVYIPDFMPLRFLAGPVASRIITPVTLFTSVKGMS